jgi:hypothetical protein
MPSDVHESEP